MAIDYDWLKTTVATWLHRSDLTSQVPTFIALAEDEINTELRLRVMETSADLAVPSGARTVALPELFLEPLTAALVDGDRDKPLTFRASLTQDESAGAPQFWTIEGDNLVFQNAADRAYTVRLRYIARLDIANTGTNGLLDNYRGLYLYGALMQASAYLVKDARVPQWAAMYESLKRKVNKREGRSHALATLVTEFPLAGQGSNFYQG